jgi:uncharacterized membrane protein YphA (DoxX/SURF4 family)/peroxiredoxin
MKIIANICRYLVGGIFVFSGFVKLVDPVGTGIKLHEYFDVFGQDLPAFKPFFDFFSHNSLPLSLFFCVFEVILGFALLFSFKMRWSAWLSLLMMTFFTFLTFYSAYFNKVTDCGCFGDFLKLKPWHSFRKDVILMILIGFIFVYQSKFKNFNAGFFISALTIAAFAIGIHAIYYLPSLDFLPYAVGKNIPEQMKPLEKPKMIFIMEKNGVKSEYDTFPTDTTLKYVEAIVLNEDQAKAKITDYSFQNNMAEEVKDSTFTGKKILLLIQNQDETPTEHIKELNDLMLDLGKQGIQPMVLTSMGPDKIKAFKEKNGLTINAYIGDEKVLKTMARANPVLMLMENGIVKAKWSALEIPNKNEVLSELK